MTGAFSSLSTAYPRCQPGPGSVMQQRRVALSHVWLSIPPEVLIGFTRPLEASRLVEARLRATFTAARIWVPPGTQSTAAALHRYQASRFAHLPFIRTCPIYSMPALR